MTREWEATWRSVVALEGETFHQKRGKAFTYTVRYGAVHPTTTNRALPRSHFEKAILRIPLDGPGEIQDLQGPSYIWAILTDPRVSQGNSTATGSPVIPPAVTPNLQRAFSNSALPGTLVSAEELRDMRFIPFDLEIDDAVSLPFGETGVNWNTVGDVPASPGVYAFTVEDDEELRVTYVGLTSHLWMVTKGRLPDGSGRGGQRYGRPKHAGTTRTRVNTLVAEQVILGRTVRHWVKPVSDAADLPELEESLIQKWDLRLAGWNRG